MDRRIILYIDILGFSNFVKEGGFDSEMVTWFEELISRENFEEKFEENGFFDWISNIKSQAFSDSFIVSIPEFNVERKPHLLSSTPTRSSLFPLVLSALDIQFKIFQRLGLLIRGGVHVGELYQNQNCILGNGYLEALELERHKVYPAIYLSDELVALHKNEIKNGSPKLYGEDLHGTFLRPSFKNAELSLQKINNGISKAKKRHHRLKWLWMKQQFETYKAIC